VTTPNVDLNIRRLREQISDADRALVEAMNARLKLVARLKRYKESQGIEFVDLEREEWMLNYLLRASRGPLSPEGLRELFTEVLDLTKREVTRAEEAETAEKAGA
jgi:chorismate mutase